MAFTNFINSCSGVLIETPLTDVLCAGVTATSAPSDICYPQGGDAKESKERPFISFRARGSTTVNTKRCCDEGHHNR